MTDNEIKKALEICIMGDCEICSCRCGSVGDCRDALNKKSLDLINRQKAEIERLQEDGKRLKKVQMQLDDLCIMHNIIKAEAVKEFAERSEKELFIKQEQERKEMLGILKTYRGAKAYSDTETATDNWLRGYGEAVQDVLSIFDNLLKEKVGE